METVHERRHTSNPQSSCRVVRCSTKCFISYLKRQLDRVVIAGVVYVDVFQPRKAFFVQCNSVRVGLHVVERYVEEFKTFPMSAKKSRVKKQKKLFERGIGVEKAVTDR